MDNSYLFSMKNELFRSYLFYSCLLALKVLAMSALTGAHRFRYMAFMNPEDAGFLKLKPRIDDHVERIRRAHQNDIENIPLFFVASLGYILTNPLTSTAMFLFRTYTAARFIHTFVYAIYVTPQPARVLSYTVGALITFYMAVRTIIYVLYV